MAEANQKQPASFQNWLYRAERGQTTAGDPFLKIVPTNPQGKFAGDRQIAATVYEIAATLERVTDDIDERWAIRAEPEEGRITIELSKPANVHAAETIIERVLSEMNIPAIGAK